MRFKSKFVVIVSVQLLWSTWSEMCDFAGGIPGFQGLQPEDVRERFPGTEPKQGEIYAIIPTLEGPHLASQGDWVVRGLKGEFYPVKPDIFAMKYEVAPGESVEQEIQRKGLNAPRVTPDQVEATIKTETYYVFPGTMLTVCCLTLRNGFNVVGESACASPDNFDEAIGRRIARDNAKAKIWALEGYLLRERLASGS